CAGQLVRPYRFDVW
nr:immunoglobulin heavy chain junction region [Macaca mulatta]MOV47407.1 immunoglobulin heavy chain junction region [Macaca mulatta]MOV47454.1 immunoglobulin heavy chain junction region [Macaca mulatta]MOV47478.1 immunoglobulin heavy chain junction region [Macaca mulatta]MOV47489.1 immunoglobulin heavy chain junction region [Macaca mulatta]